MPAYLNLAYADTEPRTPGLVLHVDDYDDEGTRYDLIGRGAPLASYCIQTIRRAIVARMTPGELHAMAHDFPEYVVTRVIADPYGLARDVA